MRKQLLAALTMAVTFFSACAQSSKTTRTKTRSHGKISASTVTSVAMQRGACFGRCPEYVLTIKSDGTVTYKGTRNAPSLGTYQKNIGAENAGKLLAEFTALRVDTLQGNYTARIPDVPGLSFTFIVNGSEKFVGNAHFGPEFLNEMSARVDEYGKVDATWKKIADAPRADE